MNWSILVQIGFISWFDLPWSKWSLRQQAVPVLLLYARAVFSSCAIASRPSCCASDLLLLKLLEFLRCGVPLSLTSGWCQRFLTHDSESLRTVSLIQATTSLPILWSIDWTLTSLSRLKESITSLFLIFKPWILIELLSSGPSQRTKPLLYIFQAWRQNVQYSLSLDAHFAPFLADNFTWLKTSSTAPSRGLDPDGDDVSTTRRRTAFQKNLHLELMLPHLANFCPVISRSSIVKNLTFISSV